MADIRCAVAARVALFVFRRAHSGDLELLVGKCPIDVSGAFTLPFGTVGNESEVTVARCLSEAAFDIPLTAIDVDMWKSSLFVTDDRFPLLRGFPVRSTSAFNAVARDGRLRCGRVYEFVSLSQLATQERCIIPDMLFPISAIRDFLNDYIVRIEAAFL